jgi:hypothetical protein
VTTNKKNSSKKVREVDVNNLTHDVDGEMNFRRGGPGDYPFPLPQRLNMDVIAIMSDEEVYSRAASLEGERNKIVDYRLDPFNWEVEIAYLRREMGIRKVRRDLHEKFMKENAALLAEISEEGYAEFEFNSHP